MATLTIDFIMSLDGYGAAEGWPGLWGIESSDYLEFLETDDAKPHTALMGATTYRLMSGFAKDMPEDPGLQSLTAVPKRVFSSSIQEPLEWSNSELVSGDGVEAVRGMKESDQHPLRTIGSLSLSRSLLKAGLVDRYRVVVFPVVNGMTGKDRLFDDYPDLALELVEHRTFDKGLQLLEYEPEVLKGPPGVEG